MKYDKMIAITQEESKRKMQMARNAISDMLNNMERITVAELVRKTGLSRGFFYKNEEIRAEMDAAIRKQGVSYNPKQVIIDKAMGDKMLFLKTEVLKLKSQIEDLNAENQKLLDSIEKLKAENERLEKQLRRKEVSFLKQL
ncbi:MAG: DUF6262 family protein [Clostridia bacterium]